MTETERVFDRRAFLAGCAALGIGSLVSPTLAWATTSADKFAEADAAHNRIIELQDELTLAVNDYYAALDEYDAAMATIDEANAKIAELQVSLSKRARGMYRGGGLSVFDLLLGATSFDEFATNWSILTSMNEDDTKKIDETKALRAEVEEQKQIAEERMAEAERIRDEAAGNILYLEQLRDQLDSEALALVEQEQAERAAAAAAHSRNYAYNSSNVTRAIPSHGSVVDYAMSRIGCPYAWGADGPDMFDCSGLVRWAYQQIGITIPHQTEEQYYAASAWLPLAEARPGDVLWVSYGDGYNGHVGIALVDGGEKYVHAPTFGTCVRDTDPVSWAGFTHTLRFA